MKTQVCTTTDTLYTDNVKKRNHNLIILTAVYNAVEIHKKKNVNLLPPPHNTCLNIILTHSMLSNNKGLFTLGLQCNMNALYSAIFIFLDYTGLWGVVKQAVNRTFVQIHL